MFTVGLQITGVPAAAAASIPSLVVVGGSCSTEDERTSSRREEGVPADSDIRERPYMQSGLFSRERFTWWRSRGVGRRLS